MPLGTDGPGPRTREIARRSQRASAVPTGTPGNTSCHHARRTKRPTPGSGPGCHGGYCHRPCPGQQPTTRRSPELRARHLYNLSPRRGAHPWGHSLATWGAQGAEPGAPHGGTAWQAGRGQGVTWKRHWPWPFPSRSVVRKARTTSEREWHLLSGACWFLGCSPEPRGAGRNLQPSSGEATTARAGSSHARGSPGRGVRLGRSRPWEVAAFQLPGLSSPRAPTGH